MQNANRGESGAGDGVHCNTWTLRRQVVSVTVRAVKVLERVMEADESSSRKALKLVDSGMSQAEAAKECGITRQAVDDALKRRKVQEAKALGDRACSECGQPLASDARADATTCSGACRVSRSRRLAKEKEAGARASINAERAKLGLPPH